MRALPRARHAWRPWDVRSIRQGVVKVRYPPSSAFLGCLMSPLDVDTHDCLASYVLHSSSTKGVDVLLKTLT